MDKENIIQGLAIVIFIIGFILIAFTTWWLTALAGVSEEIFSWTVVQRGVILTGTTALIGLALVVIGMIVTLLTKSKR